MKCRAHRGNSYYFPENTMLAFESAVHDGVAQIETDPRLTKDGVIVLMHDPMINRTCRNKDGSIIERELYVSNLTYKELMQYDAGIAKGEQFKGCKIPRLDELLALAENTDVLIALDKKVGLNEMTPIFDTIERYNTQVSFSTADIERIKCILSRFPNALIDYDGNTTDEDLKAVLKYVPRENLLVWLYLDRPNFAWLTDRLKASKEVCDRVKRYANLAIANIHTTYDFHEALSYDPDIIEI